MNFIGKKEGAETQVELKYCERCGGLFLRPQATDLVHCASCMSYFAAQPDFIDGFELTPQPRPSNPRMPKGPKIKKQRIQGAAQIEYLQGVAAREVRI